MKSVDPFKETLKKDKRQRRKAICKMTYIWVTSIVLILSLFCVTLSWRFEAKQWLSTMLISVGTSAITGCVLYFLSNLRANKKSNLQAEVKGLEQLRESLNAILCYSFYTSQSISASIKEEVVSFNDLIDQLYEASCELSKTAVSELGFDIDDPFDMDKLEDLKDQYQEEDKRKLLEEISKQYQPVYNRIFKLYNDKKELLLFFNASFI